MNVFRLISVDIRDHKILGSFHLDFSKQEFEIGGVPEDVFTSVIIGKNGIGKSRLLRVLADIFVDLKGIQGGDYQRDKKVNYQYKIKYEKKGSGDRYLNHLYTNKKWHVKQERIQIAEFITLY